MNLAYNRFLLLSIAYYNERRKVQSFPYKPLNVLTSLCSLENQMSSYETFTKYFHLLLIYLKLVSEHLHIYLKNLNDLL